MPLMTQLHDRAGRPRKIGWAWEDRMICVRFVILDGGTVGEIDSWKKLGLTEFGYVGAGCDHTFKTKFGYSQVDTKKTIWIRPGQSYHEWRA